MTVVRALLVAVVVTAIAACGHEAIEIDEEFDDQSSECIEDCDEAPPQEGEGSAVDEVDTPSGDVGKSDEGQQDEEQPQDDAADETDDAEPGDTDDDSSDTGDDGTDPGDDGSSDDSDDDSSDDDTADDNDDTGGDDSSDDDSDDSSDDNGDDSSDSDNGQNDQSGDDGYDLQCADDDAICRFCGPPEDVVTECPDGDDSFECQVFELINEIRADHGRDELDYDGTLAESGMIHAMDLSLCDYFAHDSLDGTSFFERCAENGYSGTCTGENIGGGQSTPEDVVEAWMNSPGHRDNILYDNHTEVGIAYYEGSGTYGRYWLKHFGRKP